MASFNLKRFIKNPAKGLKNAGRSIGKIVDNPYVKTAGALALGATGVGAPAAAGILAGVSGAGKVLKGQSLPKALPGLAMDAATAAAMSKVGGSDLFKGLTSRVRGLPLVNRIPGVGTGGFAGNQGIPALGDLVRRTGNAGELAEAGLTRGGGGRVSDILSGITSTRRALGIPAINARNVANAAAGGAPISGGGNIIDRIFGAIKQNPLQAGMLGLAGVSGVAAQDAARRSGRLQETALDRLRGEWTAGAPLREAGRARMLNPVRPDLTDVFTWGGVPKTAPVAGVPALPAPRARPVLANPLRKRKAA